MTTTTTKLTMQGKGDTTFKFGSTKRTTAEAFRMLQSATKTVRQSLKRETAAQFKQAQALYMVKSEGLALTLLAPSERKVNQGETAFSNYYTKILGMTEGQVTRLVNWGRVSEVLGVDVPISHAAALAPVDNDSMTAVYDLALSKGKGKGASRKTIDAARVDLGLAPKGKGKGKGKSETSAPPAVAPPAPVGLLESINLTMTAIQNGDLPKPTKLTKSQALALAAALTDWASN